VRAPARLDRELRLPPAGPPYIIAGGPDFVSEVANVFGLGYRAQPTPDWSYSATAFLHDWQGLRSGQPPPNAQVQNMIDGRTHGVEAWASWQALPTWRLSAGLSTLKKNLKLQAGSTDPDGPANLGDDPDYQWSLRSAFTPAEGHEFDVSLRRVAALPKDAVPAYTAVDARYGWRITPSIELSLVGQNLFGTQHAEFGSVPARSEIDRSIALWLRFTL
jgi:iron complex outermembrane receptor protein